MTPFVLLGWFGQTEIIVIAIVVLLLFGGRKIPELMRGLGKGIRSYKSGLNEEEPPTEKGKESLPEDK
jgi:sec-independent protein translocase protein TatA